MTNELKCSTLRVYQRNTLKRSHQMVKVIQAKDQTWCVLKETASGDIHDFFKTRAEAVQFALTYYGVSA